MDDVLRLFIAEARETLDIVDDAAQCLARGEWGDVAQALRAVHSVKGSAAFLDECTIESVAHAVEAVLSDWRDGRLADPGGAALAVQGAAEAIGRRITSLEADGTSDPDISHVLQALQASRGQSVPRLGDLLVADGALVPAQLAAAVRMQRNGDPRHLGEILVAHGAVAPDDVLSALTKQRYARGSAENLTVAVPAGVLQRLSFLADEFATALRDRIDELAAAPETAAWLEMIQVELAEQIGRIRYQPVGEMLRVMGQQVGPMAAALDKKIRVIVDDQAGLLDRAVLARLAEALRHLVRNAVDHGVEDPQRRMAAGKPAEGVITLAAQRREGEVRVTVSDDGDGINLEAVRSKAWRSQEAEDMTAVSDQTLLQMIFLPGFTTADYVTRLSGRGVGMDAVAATVAALGGTIQITTGPGTGTSVTLCFPEAEIGAAAPAVAPLATGPAR